MPELYRDQDIDCTNLGLVSIAVVCTRKVRAYVLLCPLDALW